MKPIFPAITAIFALLPAIAHADEKADAILKEVRIRMQNVTKYSVTIRLEESNDNPVHARFIMQRPDKYLLSATEPDKSEVILIRNGSKFAARQGGVALPLSAKAGQAMFDNFLPIISGNFGGMFKKGIKSTQYITQKMLDETTVVDVIDIIPVEDPSIRLRVYVDNNSQIRNFRMTSKDKSVSYYFLNPTTDPLITEKTFSLE